MPRPLLLYLAAILFSPGIYTLRAQDVPSDSAMTVILKSDEDLLAELLAHDSTSLLDLLDSLMKLRAGYSMLSVSTGYISQITNAGRNFGIEQYGLHLSTAYYHRSGLYGDITGYWNSDLEPNYNPTVINLGYMRSLGRRWMLNAGYEYFWYNQGGTADGDEPAPAYPLRHSFNLAGYFDLKWLSTGPDYSLLAGDETAHRLRWSVMGNINIRTKGFIDRINIMPGAGILLGNANVYFLNATYPYTRAEEFRYVHRKMVEEYGFGVIRWLRQNDRPRYQQLFEETYQKYQSDFQVYELQSDNVFGIMNYSLFLPAHFYAGNFGFSLQYQFNIPVALPGEDIELAPNSFFGFGFFYRLNFPARARTGF
jgi:hypothetical protein